MCEENRCRGSGDGRRGPGCFPQLLRSELEQGSCLAAASARASTRSTSTWKSQSKNTERECADISIGRNRAAAGKKHAAPNFRLRPPHPGAGHARPPRAWPKSSPSCQAQATTRASPQYDSPCRICTCNANHEFTLYSSYALEHKGAFSIPGKAAQFPLLLIGARPPTRPALTLFQLPDSVKSKSKPP